MRAITVRQPWAWAIIHGGKNIENRTQLGMWRRLAGQTVAVHVGVRDDSEAYRDPVLRRAYCDHGLPPTLLTRGAILGVVTVTDVHWADDCGGCSPWGQGPWIGERRICHLTLANPRPLTVPFPVRGKLGAWHLSEDIEAAVLSDLAAHGVSA